VPIFLPVAELSINAFWLIGAGAMVGFLSGLLGVGGGFLLTPILMMIGIPPTVAAASDTNAIVATSASGVAAHFRLGNVDIKMGSILLLGGLTGAAIGVEIIKVLRALGNADVLIKLTYIVVLGSVGGLMFVDSLRNLRRGRMMAKPGKPAKTRSFLAKLPLQMSFPRSRVQHSVLVPFSLCAVVGVLAAIMGVGGGFLMVPMMVYFLRMPAHAAVGTDLFQILFTCAGVTYMQATANHTVDLVLALLLAAGSTIGAQVGAIVSKRLRGEQLMIILATLALAVVLRMGFSLVLAPASLLQLGHGHGEGEPAATTRREMRPSERAPDRRSVRVHPEKIHIGANYSGTDIRIEGIAPPGSKVVVVARGPDTEEVFDRKGRAGPIWITTGKVHVAGVPSLFIRYASEPAENFLPRAEIERLQLDPAAIRRQMRMAPPDPEQDRLREDYVRLKVNQRVYRLVDSGLRMGAPEKSGVPFSAAFHWPRKAPPATYRVLVHECRDGVVAGTATVPLEVVKVGFPATVARLAANQAPLYGVIAIIVAMLAGFGIDFLAARLRRRLTRPARDAGAAEAKEKPVGKHYSH
jgi:uncharacterized protein (TIGR02186 family)